MKFSYCTGSKFDLFLVFIYSKQVFFFSYIEIGVFCSVAICPYLPIKGVSFILGNDLAGGRVLAAPEVVPSPVVIKNPYELEEKFPDTFPVCVATRAMSRKRPRQRL